jgi:Predicted soluble lytic transglycosylase fused to an ABC-type amino acid-binding protein
MSAAFTKEPQNTTGQYDLADLRRAGEIIVVTLSGPETYYDYHGLPMGLQYALAEDYASTEGLKVRMEIAKDTAELLQMLSDGNADLLALPVPCKLLKEKGLVAAGVHNSNEDTAWAVRSSAKELIASLNEWYTDNKQVDVMKTEMQRMKEVHQVKKRVQSVYLSKERGIISVYDHLFKSASATTGWDWKLIAAQSFQESGFDPNARSWAGAQGLMQLMPKTAASLGVSPDEVNDPRRNVEGAANLIRRLTGQLSDIRDGNERIKFVLASYNGGLGHVRDAMALARKYGKNSQQWDDVAPYILGLQKPQYYRDPVVRYGYMIGSETAGYVQSILARWRSYGGNVMLTSSPELPINSNESKSSHNSTTSTYKNKYSSGKRILSPDDPEFNQMQ